MRLTVLAACLVFGLAPATVFAEPAGVSAPAARRVRVLVAAEPRQVAALEQVLSELIGRLHIAVSVTRTPRVEVDGIARGVSEARHLADVWIDLSDDHRATLYILDGERDRVLVRELPRSPGGDEILREELGHIIETSLEGLLSGSSIGVPRAEAFGPAAPLVAAAPLPSPPVAPPLPLSSVQVGLRYEAALLAPDLLIAHGPAASLIVRSSRARWHPGVWLGAHYRQPVHTGEGSVGARLEGGALRVLASVTALLGGDAALRLGLGGGADLIEVRPEPLADEPLRYARPRVLRVGVARAASLLELRIAALTSVCAGLVLDADLSDTRLVVARSAGDETVLRLATLRPGLEFGVEVP